MRNPQNREDERVLESINVLQSLNKTQEITTSKAVVTKSKAGLKKTNFFVYYSSSVSLCELLWMIAT